MAKLPKDLRWESTGRTLGSGGQATVEEVKDKTGEYDNYFALKQLGSGKSPKAYERFFREVAAIKELDHPNIIRIIDHSEPSDSFQFYVMELVPRSVSLKKLIGTDKNPFYANATKALRLFSQIVNAIESYSTKNVTHRDLSPANILIFQEEDGSHNIKIIDFGLVQRTDNEQTTNLTDVDEGVGTIHFMAPECEPGAPGKIEIMADYYSAGKILWAAITNLKAFGRETPVFTHKSLPNCLPNSPDTWHLHHIFEKTIRANPEDRWRNPLQARKTIRKVEFLLNGRYPPLEKIREAICPICGFGTMRSFEGSYLIFGNLRDGFYAGRCDYCGFSRVVDSNIIQEIFKNRELLS